jgi:hypothetical protein
MVRRTGAFHHCSWLRHLHRLRHSYPAFLNTSGLLVDVVSVMGKFQLLDCLLSLPE